MAIRAARSPSQGNGSRKPNIANEGIVCRMLAAPITGVAHRGERVSQIPAGTVIAMANSIAPPASHKCSRVRVTISLPYFLRKLLLIRALPALYSVRFFHRDDRRKHRPRSPVGWTA